MTQPIAAVSAGQVNAALKRHFKQAIAAGQLPEGAYTFRVQQERPFLKFEVDVYIDHANVSPMVAVENAFELAFETSPRHIKLLLSPESERLLEQIRTVVRDFSDTDPAFDQVRLRTAFLKSSWLREERNQLYRALGLELYTQHAYFCARSERAYRKCADFWTTHDNESLRYILGWHDVSDINLALEDKRDALLELKAMQHLVADTLQPHMPLPTCQALSQTLIRQVLEAAYAESSVGIKLLVENMPAAFEGAPSP